MGRSVMTHPTAVATVYRTISNLHTYCQDCDIEVDDSECPECGAEMYDEFGDVAQDEYDCLVDWIREDFKAKFPSMEECDRWASGFGAMNELRCIVANQLCDVFISEYCGMAAISVVPTGCEDSYGYNDTAGLATYWTGKHAVPFARERFGEYDRLGTFSNGEAVYQRRESA